MRAPELSFRPKQKYGKLTLTRVVIYIKFLLQATQCFQSLWLFFLLETNLIIISFLGV